MPSGGSNDKEECMKVAKIFRNAACASRKLRWALSILFVVAMVSATSAQSSFLLENQPTFAKTVLSNGIPVYMKVQSAHRVFHISLVLNGGSLITNPERAGWEKIALATMARGSQHYPYQKASSMLDRTSSSILASTQFEYSTFSLTTLDKYRDELLSLWGDMLTAPSFEPLDFDKAKEDASLALQAMDQDPWSKTQKVMNQSYFKGHPYGVNPEGTEQSISPMLSGDASQWYSTHFSADRIFVVAVGDFDPVELANSLESLLGGIPNLKLGSMPQPPRFPRGPSGALITEAHEQSRGTMYLRGDFAAPACGSDDYFATALAARIFSDLLFSVVRDKYGAVYTPSAMIRAFGANYGSIMIYKTNVPGMIKKYIDEAANLLAQGRVVSVDPTRTEKDGYMSIADAIDTYKLLYMNEYFEAVRNTAAIASLMIRSVRYAGDPSDWLMDQSRIEMLDAQMVHKAFETYIMNGALLWVAVGDPELLDALNPSDFQSMSQ